MRIAIVGGGIGGLAAAIGLKRAGLHVTVFERASQHPSTGTGLGIWPSALQALDRLGLGSRAREIGRRQSNGAIHRPDGTRIAAIDVDRIEKSTGDPVHLLSRPALLGLLASAFAPGEIKFGHDIDDPSRLVHDFDVVVGADGIHSRVRRMMFGERYPLRSAGMTVWRGTVDLDSTSAAEWWGRGMKFGLTPQEPGRTNWYAAVSDTIDGDPWTLFADWADPIPQVLERATPDGTLHHQLSDLTPLPSYVKGNCVLIGDAAHAMTPDLGQGACQALIDGVTLADCLAAAVSAATHARHPADTVTATLTANLTPPPTATGPASPATGAAWPPTAADLAPPSAAAANPASPSSPAAYPVSPSAAAAYPASPSSTGAAAYPASPSSAAVAAGLAAFDRARRRPTQRLAAVSARMSRLSQARRLLSLRDNVIRLALHLPLPT